MSQSKQADAAIRDHAAYSAAAAVIPFPLGDVLAITALQLDLVKVLANIYEQDFTASLGKSVVTSLTGTSLARMGASAVKMIPGIGTWSGGAVQLALASGSTYAIGHLFKSHFAAGGTLDTFNPEKARDMYEKYVEKGKATLAGMDLTGEEYDKLKRKLIAQMD